MSDRSSSAPESRPNLFGMDLQALELLLREYDVPRFHAGQIYRWLYARGELDIQGWTDLPAALREELARRADLSAGEIVDRVEARDRTVKYRVQFADGTSVESVYMEQAGRITLCLSSQVGCALGCKFCLTAKMGLVRHLDPGQIVGQLTRVKQDREIDEQGTNIVFMGMGEPLHNYDGVMGAFALMIDPRAFGISRRRITVSTSGMVPAIEKLAAEPVRPRLAVSLNATTDEVRTRIMPINKKYPLRRLLDACDHFARATGDRYTFEYVLLEGVNDSAEDMQRLAGLARRNRAKINLIPFNTVPGWLPFQPPDRERVLALCDLLESAGASATVRWSRGAEARAACGQLALIPDSPSEEACR